MTHLPFYKYSNDIVDDKEFYEDNKKMPFRFLKDKTTDCFVEKFLNDTDNTKLIFSYNFYIIILVIEILPYINQEIYDFLDKQERNSTTKNQILNIIIIQILNVLNYYLKEVFLMKIYQENLFQCLKKEGST